MKAILIHGAYGNPDENWLPWLKIELETEGYEVFAPAFPTPRGQSLDNWMKVMKPYINKIDEDTIFVAHSIASAFVMRILERIDVQVKACFFVAGFIDSLDNERFDSINYTFIEKEFDFKKIRQNSKKIFFYASDNDPYVPLMRTAKLAKALDAQLTIMHGAGHFNEESGYTKFLKLYSDIIKMQ